MEWISSLFLTGYGHCQRSRTSFVNTCIKKNFGYWLLNVEISLNTSAGSFLSRHSCADSFREDLTSWGKYLSCLIFFTSRGKSLNVCGCCELSAELFESISQWETIVSSCDFKHNGLNGGKCKRFCQFCFRLGKTHR
jgi:hypothetical protein